MNEIFKIILLLLIFLVSVILLSIIIETGYRYIIKKKLEEISPSDNIKTKEIKFKSIYDFDQTYTLDSFKLNKPTEVGVLKFEKWGVDGFKVYLNERLIVSRKCLKGFYYTKNGCSQINTCQNKGVGEVVADTQNKYILYKCDGHNGIKDIISCYENKQSGIPCGDANPCFNKPNGFIPKVLSLSKYLKCFNGVVKEDSCIKDKEYFNHILNQCTSIPKECLNLSKNKSIILDIISCKKDKYGNLNISFTKQTGGNCDSTKSFVVNIPELWTSSIIYKECLHGFWNFKFCPQIKNSNNYIKILEEIRDVLDDGILYSPPNLDVSVFDENLQNCIPFDYIRHYKNKKIPLLYSDIYMSDQYNSIHLPTMVYNSNTKELESTTGKKLNSSSNKYENFSNNYISNYTDRDENECLSQYQEYIQSHGMSEFVGLLTVAYSDVILSCRFGKPANKLIIDKSKYPSLWGRMYFGENSFTDNKHNVHICKGYLHKFIPTCVENVECINADALFPLEYPGNSLSVGITDNLDLSFCSKSGQLQYILENKIKIDKYCSTSSKTHRVHPYYNIPIDCQNKTIIRDLSFRDPSLKTFKMYDESIFKNDINALNLHFFGGIEDT